jgi:hypothetical protein
VTTYFIYDRATGEKIEFEDQRELHGHEIVEAAGRRWQLHGHRHAGAEVAEGSDQFEAEPLPWVH